MAKLTQEDLLNIFNELKKIISPYRKGNMHPRIDIQGKYDLWAEKEVEVEGRKMDAVYFCGLIIQSSYVGFYFMPVYARPEMKAELAPELVKCLKGKSCFHMKTADKEMMKHVKDAMKKGYDMYKKMGWY
ncbi:MAG: hypothetical protein KDC07_10740 [Chitinophagaceae bacterium]|nr:hypothetical protein [Chitinophagaceae bacterium]